MYWFALFYNAYRKGDYRGALGFARKVDLPQDSTRTSPLRRQPASSASATRPQRPARELLPLKPAFEATARGELGQWFQPDLVDDVLDEVGLEPLPELPSSRRREGRLSGSSSRTASEAVSRSPSWPAAAAVATCV